MKAPIDYVSKQGATLDEGKWHGYASIPVLQFLNGHPWDHIALAWVSSMRPDKIRVIEYGGMETLDARTWRVSVYLDENSMIQSIRQEVCVSLPPDIDSGHELKLATPGLHNNHPAKPPRS